MQLKKYDEKIIKNKGEAIYKDYLNLIESKKPTELIVEIEAILAKHKMSLNKFISILMQYLEEQQINFKYSNFCEELLNSPNAKEYLNEHSIPSELLSSILHKYLLYSRPDIFFGNKNTLRTLNSLIAYNDKLNKEREKEMHDKETFLPLIETLAKDFLNQDYSLERFCLLRNISKQYFYTKNGIYIRKLALYNQGLYQELVTDLEIREKSKKENLTNDIYKVLTMIKENKEFDAIDFYQATKYGPTEFLETATTILSFEDNKLLRAYLNRYKDIYKDCNLKSELLKEKYTFTIDSNLIETTEEDRKAILDFLEQENIPISSILVFQDACKRYYKGNLKSTERSK